MRVSLFTIANITAQHPTGDARDITIEITDDGKHAMLTEPCPNCGKSGSEIRGGGITHHDHDTYYARATALCCGKHVGELRARVDTIFGIEEDERVLNGRPRVY